MAITTIKAHPSGQLTVGSEIAAIVPDALFVAFDEAERALTVDDLLLAAQTVVPLSKTSAAKVDDLRTWAKGRARLASTAEAAPVKAGRQVDLD